MPKFQLHNMRCLFNPTLSMWNSTHYCRCSNRREIMIIKETKIFIYLYFLSLDHDVHKRISITAKQHNNASTRPHEQISSGSRCSPSNQRFRENYSFVCNFKVSVKWRILFQHNGSIYRTICVLCKSNNHYWNSESPVTH